jgi:hypothetical protein
MILDLDLELNPRRRTVFERIVDADAIPARVAEAEAKFREGLAFPMAAAAIPLEYGVDPLYEQLQRSLAAGRPKEQSG